MKLRKFPVLYFVLLSDILLVGACSDDVFSANTSENKFTVDSGIESLSSRLFNTGWTYQYSEFYDEDNGRYSHTSFDFADKFTFTFSDESFSNNKYKLFVNGNSVGSCWWYIDENGVNYSALDYGYMLAGMTAGEVGRWSVCGGFISNGQVAIHTDSKLIVKDYYQDGINYVQHIYTASSNSGGSGGGSASDEKPDIGFYDFTATNSSLKVQYKIYNSAEAGVSSAKVYYGTTNNPSKYKAATVSGTLITANITGLKSGTTYYVKCEAAGKGGKTTTTVTKCITNY